MEHGALLLCHSAGLLIIGNTEQIRHGEVVGAVLGDHGCGVEIVAACTDILRTVLIVSVVVSVHGHQDLDDIVHIDTPAGDVGKGNSGVNAKHTLIVGNIHGNGVLGDETFAGPAIHKAHIMGNGTDTEAVTVLHHGGFKAVRAIGCGALPVAVDIGSRNRDGPVAAQIQRGIVTALPDTPDGDLDFRLREFPDLGAVNTVDGIHHILPDGIGAVLIHQQISILVPGEGDGHEYSAVFIPLTFQDLGILRIEVERQTFGVNGTAVVGSVPIEPVLGADHEMIGIRIEFIGQVVHLVRHILSPAIGIGAEVELAVIRLIAVDEQDCLAVLVVDRQRPVGDIAQRIDQHVGQIHHGFIIHIFRSKIIIVPGVLTEVIAGGIVGLQVITLLAAVEIQGEALCIHGPDGNADGHSGFFVSGNGIIELPFGGLACHMDDNFMAGDHAVGGTDLIDQQVGAVHEGKHVVVINHTVGLLGIHIRQIRQIGMDNCELRRCIGSGGPAGRGVLFKTRLGIVGHIIDPNRCQIIGDLVCGIAAGTLGGIEGQFAALIPVTFGDIINIAIAPAFGQRCQTQLDFFVVCVALLDVVELPDEAFFRIFILIAVPGHGFVVITDGDVQGGGIHIEGTQDHLLRLTGVGVGVTEGQGIPAVFGTQAGLQNHGIDTVRRPHQIPGLDGSPIGVAVNGIVGTVLVVVAQIGVVQLKGGIALIKIDEVQTVLHTVFGFCILDIGDLQNGGSIVQAGGGIAAVVVQLHTACGLCLGIGLALGIDDGPLHIIGRIVGQVDLIGVQRGFRRLEVHIFKIRGDGVGGHGVQLHGAVIVRHIVAEFLPGCHQFFGQLIASGVQLQHLCEASLSGFHIDAAGDLSEVTRHRTVFVAAVHPFEILTEGVIPVHM